jgi:peptidoglycan hydrolase-like protein with peptidoglycan-binding domain
MSTPEERRRMAAAIVNFEARRDAQGHLKVYKLPRTDGGGRYEVAGINEHYNKATADVLVALVEQRRFAEAEALAVEFVAQDTDRAQSWTSVPALESYLRDSVFNRGPSGGAHILQRALGITDDGVIGARSRAAMEMAEADAPALLQRLRIAREKYEDAVAGPRPEFRKGLINRWNQALEVAKTFPLTRTGAPQIVVPTPVTPVPPAEPAIPSPLPLAPEPGGPATLPALQVGMHGARVAAWQAFLLGQGFGGGPTDGYFGEHTRDATKAFQRKYKLEEDGVAGRATLLKAAALGFELIEEPADDTTSSNFPPRPSFSPLVTNPQQEAVLGHYDYVPAPTRDNPEGIRILGTWERDNIVRVPIPQLRKALGNRAPETMAFHRLAAKQLQGMWADWEKAKLLDRVLTYDGSFVPRFVRGSRSALSNHAFGSAFDINERYNSLGKRPALVGKKGSVRELVPIANGWGFYWGGHYNRRPDGMHFEVAFLK